MAELYCFGRFALNPDSRQLYIDGMRAKVGTTGVDILLALVEQAGKFVSKDEIMSRVWGRSAVGDHRLHVHVSELRRAIGDDCIATKSGSGYRFVAPVHRQRTQPPEVLPAPVQPKCGNLPSLWTSGEAEEPPHLIGRTEELRIVSQRLADGRLVTLTGPGGVGKTSLALHAAGTCGSLFPDGVWLVELATLGDPALVPGAVATVLGIKMSQSAAVLDTLARQMAQKKLLLVLDNCEHVIAAAALLAEALVRAAPDVKILATSREALSCSGEQVFEVPPLAFPPDDAEPTEAVREMAAVRLFIARARGADARFRIDDRGVSVAARICRRVDGLPLAIEMVSNWVEVLGLEALDAKLDGSLKAWLRARSTAPPRHSTLRATLEWSHDLLAPADRTVLRRLAVFAGGFTMEAAQTVASDESLTEEQVFEHVASLIRKSMIAVTPGSRSQTYRLLQTTRAFALEKLAASGDAERARQRHARLMLRTVERASDEWETTSDAVWLARYAPILDDLRAALDWSTGHSAQQAIAIAGASWPLWREFSLHAEGRQRLSAVAQNLRADTPTRLEARLRRGLGELWRNSDAARHARDEFGRACELYRALGDAPQLGAALSRLAFALILLGRIEEAMQSNAEALSLLEPAGMQRSLATAYVTQVAVEARLGCFERARAMGEKALRLCQTIGARRLELIVAANLMEFALEQGDVDSAIEVGRALDSHLGDSAHSDVQAFVLGIMVAAFTIRGDLDEALVVARRAAPQLRDNGLLFGLFDHLALRAGLAGRVKDAAQIIGYADALYQAVDRPREPIGERAASRLGQLLQDGLPQAEAAMLKSEGALLTEDQATALALSA